VAEPGKILLAADYSQIELRVMAHFFAGTRCCWRGFARGRTFTSAPPRKFWRGPMAQTAEHRRARSDKLRDYLRVVAVWLAQQIGVPQKEAAQFISAYFERYRASKNISTITDGNAANGSGQTLFGRIRPIPDITSPQVQIRNFAERTALNSPLQGTAADLIKLAMIAIDRRLGAEKFEAKMILQVHDELLFEAPASERNELTKLVREEMENVHKLAVRWKSKSAWERTGATWSDRRRSPAKCRTRRVAHTRQASFSPLQ